MAALARRLRSRGWLLIVVIMVLFSALGSTMGFSVETFGFYALLIPLMAALRYDRMVTSATILLGALTGSMASTVNPFSIGSTSCACWPWCSRSVGSEQPGGVPRTSSS